MKPTYLMSHNKRRKYSLEAKELLSESQMFEVKAGVVENEHFHQTCTFCDSCVGCTSACAVCVSDVA